MSINKFRGDYFFLSNFYEVPITYMGLSYTNTELAFQSMKCSDSKQREAFCNLDASKAKSRGRHVKLRFGWESIKDQVMYEVVKAKFEQNENLKRLLLATGEQPLEEGNDWNDSYWGTYNGVGQNKLGKILMKVREELR